jgi:cyclophilin family peptidyl-prolyl cis-trans isomerase
MNVKKVAVTTNKGDFTLELYADKMPLTVENFLKLAKASFYDGLTFHRIEHWLVQGGDPKGDGTGGPGWTIKLETHPNLKNTRGAIAMARASHPDSAGSQFYILKTNAEWLDGKYAVFGKVASGMDVVDELEFGDIIYLLKEVN